MIFYYSRREYYGKQNVGTSIRVYHTDGSSEKLYEIKVEPAVPKRYIGLVTIDKKTPNYSVKKLIELIEKDNSKW